MITATIVISTFQRPTLLKRTLDSLAHAEWPSSFKEVIVVENDAVPYSADVCAYHEKLPVKYVTESTRGLSHARNKGWRVASGDIILFLDDDVTVNRDTLTAYAEAFQEFGDTCFYGGPVEPDYVGQPPLPWLAPHLPWSVTGLDFPEIASEIKEPIFIGPNHAIPRRLLEHDGGYEGMSATGRNGGGVGEETRLQARLLAEGFKGRIVRRAVIHHRVPEEDCTPEWAIQRRRRHAFTDGWEAADRDGQRVERWMWRILLRHRLDMLLNGLRRVHREDRFDTELKAAYMLGFMKGLRDARHRSGPDEQS
ncbi:MAG: glycosyltransferase family 2 protein [Salinisphaera sp.]|nr:glycosyltransferase family 2 protein [Salinisphaera sp.]